MHESIVVGCQHLCGCNASQNDDVIAHHFSTQMERFKSMKEHVFSQIAACDITKQNKKNADKEWWISALIRFLTLAYET